MARKGNSHLVLMRLPRTIVKSGGKFVISKAIATGGARKERPSTLRVTKLLDEWEMYCYDRPKRSSK